MTDKSPTERLRAMLDERGAEYQAIGKRLTYWNRDGSKNDCDDADFVADEQNGYLIVEGLTPEQAIAATLDKQKVKAHPYGYEPDTGAFDATRCECGCLNDISAAYCNDCGGEIEVDMYGEKEIYHTPRNSVFAEKHDDGSLEFGGKKYIAATLGSGKLTAEQVCKAVYAHSIHADCADADWQAIADELNATLGGGECEIETTESWLPAERYHRCKHCGAFFAVMNASGDIPPCACPNCGKAVKR